MTSERLGQEGRAEVIDFKGGELGSNFDMEGAAAVPFGAQLDRIAQAEVTARGVEADCVARDPVPTRYGKGA
jgi:hypothetical protein